MSIGLEIPEEQWERVAGPLENLERQFRPLLAAIPLETEPLVVFRPLKEDFQDDSQEAGRKQP